MTKEFRPDKVFLRYQNELHAATDTNRVVVVEKSRRTGYSWAAAAIAVFESGREEKPQNTYYMGYNYDMSREFIAYVGEWAKKFEMAASEAEEFIFNNPDNPDKDIKAFRVTFANGKEIVALPSVARALRSKQGFVILDEAAFYDDLKDVLKATTPLLIWGGKLLIISTHNGEDNPFNELINDIRSGRKKYKLLRCTLKDALWDGLYKRICQKAGIEWTQEKEDDWVKKIYEDSGDGAEEEYDCVPSNSSGSYLTHVIIEKCMRPDIPIVQYEAPASFVALPSYDREQIINDWITENLAPVIEIMNPALASSLGFDFGRSGDLSVAWVMQENKDLSLSTSFVLELRNMPHEQQKQIIFYIMSKIPRLRFSAFDARGNGSYLAEVVWQKFGSSRVEQVMLTTDWYRQNTPRAKAYLEDKTVSIPKNADIMNDFKQVKLVKGVPVIPESRTKDSRGNKRHGDSFVAYIFAIYAIRKNNVPTYDGLMTMKDLTDDDENKGFRRVGTW